MFLPVTLPAPIPAPWANLSAEAGAIASLFESPAQDS